MPTLAMSLVQRCLEEAKAACKDDATRAALATVDGAGRANVRYVLVKRVTGDRVGFFTNYESSKGLEIASHPGIALAWHWWETGMQVRIRGEASKMSADESDAYFSERPRESQLGAWASPQSRVVTREFLTSALAASTAKWTESVPRPPHWGGYWLTPSEIEIWRDRPGRFHERSRFRAENAWAEEILAP